MDNEKNTSEKNEEKLQDQKLEGVSGGLPRFGEIKALGQSKKQNRPLWYFKSKGIKDQSKKNESNKGEGLIRDLDFNF